MDAIPDVSNLLNGFSNIYQDFNESTTESVNHGRQSTLNQTTDSFQYISDRDRFLVVVIVNCFFCIPVCLVGIVANIINIVVFVHQGFHDSINISLLCLAFSDLGSLLTLLWRNILYLPFYDTTTLPFDPVALIYLTGGMPHVCMVRVSGCLTAFIAFERCVCIVWPLKVKQIFTHTRTVFINMTIFVVSIGAVSPVYYTSRLTWKFNLETNRSILGLTYAEDRVQVESASFAANGVFLPASAFVLDIVCTIIMIFKLHSHAKWRKNTISIKSRDETASTNTTIKDVRVMQMVLALSLIFIVCSLPINVNFVWMLLDPEFSIEGQFANTMLVCATFSFLCEAINSSLNYFVYSSMSTKFRATFLQLFSCQANKRECDQSLSKVINTPEQH